jgi:UDP-glucose 4-epimerase
VYGELNDPLAMRTAIATVRPDRIFHPAAQSFVPASWRAPAEPWPINARGRLTCSRRCWWRELTQSAGRQFPIDWLVAVYDLY